MKLLRTVRIKLNIQLDEVLPTILLYTKAFNLISKIGFDKHCFNGITLHKESYQEIRNYLSSQLAVSARMKATEALKSIFSNKRKNKKKPATCPTSKFCPVRYDKNSYSLFLKKKEVSILTVNGRKRISINVPKFYEEYFTWKNTSADLTIKNRKVFLNISFEKDTTDITEAKNIIGIDRGINKLAVTSNNKFFGGGIVKQISRKYKKIRSALQKKGTRSAKRHLKLLSGKEKRFKADVNHCISKKIISSLSPGDTIVLENLTGIRNKRVRKPQRCLINNWNFYQLEQFLIYKGMAKSIRIEYVDPRYTSLRCSKCGYTDRGNRKSQSIFVCKGCGFKCNADLNAARSIRLKHLDSKGYLDRANVNKPIVAVVNNNC